MFIVRGRIFSIVFLFLSFRNFGQSFTLRLFYGINEVESQNNFARIDSLVSRLADKALKIKINGYADFLHSDQYNIALSQKRADAVKKHLQQTTAKKLSIVECRGFGEKNSSDNQSPEGESIQRRVDLHVEIVSSEKVPDTRPIKVPDSTAKIPTPKNLGVMAKGESIALEGLGFVPGRHAVLKQSAHVLDELFRTMQAHPKLKIEIQGHVCCTPGDTDALDEDTGEKQLSVNRAKAVYDFLLKKGINANRLRYRGFAHSKLRVPETSLENEQLNRRVEILILEN